MRIWKVVLSLLLTSFCLLLISTNVMAMPPENSDMVDEVLAELNTRNPVKIVINGEEQTVNYMPIVNIDGHTLISLTDIAEFFSCQPEFADSNQVHLDRLDKSLLFRINEAAYLSNDVEYQSGAAPCRIDTEVFLPLRIVAEEFNYLVKFKSDTRTVIINSPDYQNIEPEELDESPIPEFKLPESLPRWGTLNEVPEWSGLWPQEQIISGYFSNLANSSADRTGNIILSCNSINNKILNPGDIFSFNQIVGERLISRGYRKAPIFIGQKVVPGVGGGICQTASTLYNCVRGADLKVIERHPHTLKVTYVPNNMDATVSWGGADLKFSNNQEHPVKILITVYENYLIAAIAKVN